jgi:hypothetical protein
MLTTVHHAALCIPSIILAYQDDPKWGASTSTIGEEGELIGTVTSITQMQLAPPSSDNAHTNVKPNNGGGKNGNSNDGTTKSNRDGITRDANGNIIDSTDIDSGSGTDSGIINTGTGLGSFTLGVVVSYCRIRQHVFTFWMYNFHGDHGILSCDACNRIMP